jgi:hypothetical protein
MRLCFLYVFIDVNAWRNMRWHPNR